MMAQGFTSLEIMIKYQNLCQYAYLLVHFLLWQAAKPSGDKCIPWEKSVGEHITASND